MLPETNPPLTASATESLDPTAVGRSPSPVNLSTTSALPRDEGDKSEVLSPATQQQQLVGPYPSGVSFSANPGGYQTLGGPFVSGNGGVFLAQQGPGGGANVPLVLAPGVYQIDSLQGTAPRVLPPGPNAQPENQRVEGLDGQGRDVGGRVRDVTFLERAAGWFEQGIMASFDFITDVLKITTKLLRFPLILISVFFVVNFAAGYVASEIIDHYTTGAVSFACRLPIVNAGLPFCPPKPVSPSQVVIDFPTLMKIQGDSMDILLQESVGMSSVGWDLMHSKIAASDLITLVKISELTCRNFLGTSLENLVVKAKAASKRLRALDSLVNYAVDSTLSINDYAMNVLVAATEKHFLGVSHLSSDGSRATVQRSFTLALDKFVERLNAIIAACHEVLVLLDELDRALIIIHEIVSRERLTIIEEREELLAALWTFLGGNKSKLRAMDNHLVLLYGLSSYRAKAIAHVHRTMQAVAQMQEDAMQLRNESVLTATGGDAIDMHVQLASLRAGIERLANGRTRADAQTAAVRNAAMAQLVDPAAFE